MNTRKTLVFKGLAPHAVGWIAHIKVGHKMIAIRRDKLSDAIADAVNLVKHLSHIEQ